MEYAAAALVGILAVELFRRLPFGRCGRALWGVSQRAVKVIRSSKISDHWKEKALLAYSGRMAINTLALAGMIILLALIVGGFLTGVDYLTGSNATEFIVSILGLGVCTVTSLAYLFLLRLRT